MKTTHSNRTPSWSELEAQSTKRCLNMAVHKIPREVFYHAKDTDKTAFYICPKCVKDNFKNYKFGILKDTNIFCQDGVPVITTYVCSKCEKEKRCLRFTPEKP